MMNVLELYVGTISLKGETGEGEDANDDLPRKITGDWRGYVVYRRFLTNCLDRFEQVLLLLDHLRFAVRGQAMFDVVKCMLDQFRFIGQLSALN